VGLDVREGIAKTGLKAILDTGRPGPTVAVICELDSLRVPGHPGADPVTGAAHACGHHTQPGMLLGVLRGLTAPGVLDALSGRVAFIATPAEEFIDVSDRLGMRERGEIRLMSGKQEMIRLGAFDDVDMAMMVHTATGGDGTPQINIGGTSNAHVSHHVRFIGRSSHAGGAPDKGVNALQAATIALTAVNALRETLREIDVSRVHGIITRGGAAVNAVPDEVVYEGRVRASTVETVDASSERVVRCYRAGALAVGAQVEVTTIAGYLPLENNPVMQELFARHAATLLGDRSVRSTDAAETRGGSTDMGDLSALMPVIHPYTAAAVGTGHGTDYVVNDYDLGVVVPAKIMTATLIDLLSDGAATAKRAINGHKPAVTREKYAEFQESRFSTRLYRDE
jgi:amidohydrolase